MKKINRKEFDNGLVLLTEKRASSKKAVLLAGIKVGSVNETEDLNGGSHFTEHLLFKENKYRTAKQILEDLEQGGTDINAFTSHNITAFYIKALPSELLKAVPITYEAATNFKYNAEEFEKERKVVLTEIKRDYEQPVSCVYDLFISSLFQGTPLEKTILGTADTMGSVTKEELEKFKGEYYAPNNMIIVASGNFDESALEQKIAETYGRLPRKKIPSNDLTIPMENNHQEKIEEKKGVEHTYLMIGYRVPGVTHQGSFSLKMLKGVLSAGMSSRLFMKLREEEGIGYSVGAAYGHLLENTGIFLAYINGFDTQRFDEGKNIILKEFKDLKQNLVSDKEFERTRNLLISKIYDSLESIDSRAQNILDQEVNKTPYDFRRSKYYIQKVTKEQIREAANKYLTDEYTLTAIMPTKK